MPSIVKWQALSSDKAFFHLPRYNLKTLPTRISPSVYSPRCLSRTNSQYTTQECYDSGIPCFVFSMNLDIGLLRDTSRAGVCELAVGCCYSWTTTSKPSKDVGSSSFFLELLQLFWIPSSFPTLGMIEVKDKSTPEWFATGSKYSGS